MLQHFPPSNLNPGPVATRFINFALYVHRNDIEPREKIWSLYNESFSSLIGSIHTEKGDYYQDLTTKYNAFEIIKNSSVIVLGKDTGPELQELIQVRDYLSSKGYDARLIKDLPEIKVTSNEEKVRTWTGAARFCVMIDRKPSGHISEYQILKQQRSLLAFLRPRGYGSTYMIGDDELVDLNYIKNLNFNHSPLEVLDDLIAWAEGMLKKQRISLYWHLPMEKSIHKQS